MLNQIPVNEANNSGVFLRNYLDYIEELPDEIVRILSVVRELDVKTSNIVNETEELSEKILSTTGETKSKHYSRLQQILIKLQDINDEKIRYNQALSELIETKFRAVERDFQNNVTCKQERPQSPTSASSTAKNASIVQQVFSNLPLNKNSSTTGSNVSSSTNNSMSESATIVNNNGNDKTAKRIRRTRTDTIAEVVERAETPVKNEPPPTKATGSSNQPATTAAAASTTVKKSSSSASNNSNKKKKKKTTAKQTTNAQSNQVVEQQVSTLQDDIIDPDEETYCLCGQISYGEMILCENDACKIEWFHFSCVGLASKPKGRWYCPNCRGDRPNVLNKNLRKKYQDSPNNDRKYI